MQDQQTSTTSQGDHAADTGSSAGENVKDAAVMGVNVFNGRGPVVGFGDDPNRKIGDTNLTRFQMLVPDGDKQTLVPVVAWGSLAGEAAALKKGEIVEIQGEIRTNEWLADKDDKEGSKQNSRLEVHLNTDAGDKLEKTTDKTGRNQVTIEGEVAWAGEIDQVGEKKTSHRRILVSVPKKSPSGGDIRPTVPVSVWGRDADKGVSRGAPVTVSGQIVNDTWEDKDDASKRYRGTVQVMAEGHSFKVA